MAYTHPPIDMAPNFGALVQSYTDSGDRECLADLLQIWRPALDPHHARIGDALHHAIFIGDEPAVRMMLDAGVSPTVRQSSDTNYSPLLAASEYGKREIARLLWRFVGPDAGFDPSRDKVLACLWVAAGNGHAELVADFLDMWDGWSAEETRSALVEAASSWHDDAVAVLLAKVPYDAEALQDALGMSIERGPILPVAMWVSIVPITTPEIDLRLQRVVSRLIDAGANPNGDLYKEPLLHLAALWGHRIGALKGLLEKGANPNIQDPSTGKTALHALFRHVPSTPSLELLHHHGASPTTPNHTAETPLHAAAYNGTLAQLQLLLAACSSSLPTVATHLTTADAASLLHYACAGGRQDTVAFLLDEHNLPLDAPTANGWTPLLCALMPTKTKSLSTACRLAKFLLDKAASTEVVTAEGWTCLHALASHGASRLRLEPDDAEREKAEKLMGELASQLISHGAPVDAKAKVLRSAYVTSERVRDAWGARMAQLATEAAQASARGSSVLPDEETTPLMWAYREGQMAVFNAITAHWAEVSRRAGR
jgi:ankyrin repeat protein